MNTVPLFVGLDYHQDSIQVCVLNQQGDVLLNRSTDNDWRKLHQLVSPLGTIQRAGIEACCGAADLAEELAEQAHWPIELGHPAYVAKMKQSPDKSDFSDGRLVGDLTRVGYLPTVYRPTRYERDLRQLVNHRAALVDQARALKLRVGALLREHRARAGKPIATSRWSKAWILWAASAPELSEQARWIIGELLAEIEHVSHQMQRVEGRLRQTTQGDERVIKLMKQPGIGEVTAWVMRSYIGNFDRFRSGKQLSRYCGLSPCNASSGQRQADAGLIDGCNKLLRSTLIQAAHRLVRCEPQWKTLALSLRARGKAPCVTIAAVGNRWVRKLWHTMRSPAPAPSPKGLEA